MKHATVTLLVPGPWSDHSGFVQAMARANDGNFLAAGGLVFDSINKRHVGFEVFQRDEELADSMWVGSGRSLALPVMAAIDAHKSLVALSFDRTSPGDALDNQLRAFAGAVLQAGGHAIKVRDSGLSHSLERWETLLANDMPVGLFQALVVQVPDRPKQSLSSFGMQQFGLPDGDIHDPGTSDDPAWALFEFNVYLWQEQPVLKSGHTFARNVPGAQRYTLTHVADDRYEDGHPYLNPHGVWRLAI